MTCDQCPASLLCLGGHPVGINYCQRCYITVMHVAADKPMLVWRCADSTTLLTSMDPLEQMADCFACNWVYNEVPQHFVDLDWHPRRTLKISRRALRYADTGRLVRDKTRHYHHR